MVGKKKGPTAAVVADKLTRKATGASNSLPRLGFLAAALCGGAALFVGWLRLGAGAEERGDAAATAAGKASSEPAAPLAELPEMVPSVLWGSAIARYGEKAHAIFYGSKRQAALSKDVPCLRRSSDAEANKCMPAEGCARHVIDGLVSPAEVKVLAGLIEWLVAEAWGGGAGPPSVVDLHQGSISYKEQFVLLHKLMEYKQVNFTAEHISTYNAVRHRVRDEVRKLFQAPAVLPEMTFFSHINSSKSARNMHDEYWHSHIDTEQYGTFAVTTILYLNGYGDDYEGGAFRFGDDGDAIATALGGPPGGAWSKVEPVPGRLVAFTSGRENVHHVEPVTRGTRLALTMAFTCNEAKAASVTDWEGGGGAMLTQAED